MHLLFPMMTKTKLIKFPSSSRYRYINAAGRKLLVLKKHIIEHNSKNKTTKLIASNTDQYYLEIKKDIYSHFAEYLTGYNPRIDVQLASRDPKSLDSWIMNQNRLIKE